MFSPLPIRVHLCSSVANHLSYQRHFDAVAASARPDGGGPVVVAPLVALLAAAFPLLLLAFLALLLPLLGREPLARALLGGDEPSAGVERAGAAQAGHHADLVEHAHLRHLLDQGGH